MFGKILRSFIEKRYESQAKFAEECDVSTGYLNDLLSGRTLPKNQKLELIISCLLYTSPSPRDGLLSRMPSSA